MLLAHETKAGESLCDPGLNGSPGSSLAYRMRGDRCEGIYALQVSSTQVWLASLTDAFVFDPGSDAELKLSWRPPASAPGLALRAQSLRPKTYYRMDTSIQPPSTSFSWSSEVLSSLGLGAEEIGLLGWARLTVGGEEQEVYVPLTTAQTPAASGQSPYQVAIVSSMRLSEIFISLTPVDSRGSLGRPILAKQPLGYDFYPAKEATVFYLDKQATAGIYKLDVDCQVFGGGSATTTFWLYLDHSE